MQCTSHIQHVFNSTIHTLHEKKNALSISLPNIHFTKAKNLSNITTKSVGIEMPIFTEISN